MMKEWRVEARFRGEFAIQAFYLLNKTVTLIIYMNTPCEELFGVAHNYEKSRVIGCLAIAHVEKSRRSESDDHAECGIYIGTMVGGIYKICNSRLKTVKMTKDASFDEKPFRMKNEEQSFIRINVQEDKLQKRHSVLEDTDREVESDYVNSYSAHLNSTENHRE